MRIAVVTTSRADYGIYRPLLRALDAEADIEVGLLVSGSHLSDRHGRTVDEIEQDGTPVLARVSLDLDEDSPLAVGRAAAAAVAGFTEVLAAERPDAVVVLGDRFEMHAAAVAAVPLLLPVAHLHGGERTGGSFDELYRHSMTKLAHLHFAATEAAGRRIRAMGEEAWRVHVTGALAIDDQLAGAALDLAALQARLALPRWAPPVVVSMHPATLDPESIADQVDPLAAALRAVDGPIVVTAPNADPGGRQVAEALKRLVAERDDAAYVASLGSSAYQALLREARVLVGNSSSGIIEAATYGLPVVNVGGRQDGRERGANVVDVGYDAGAIVAAVEAAGNSAERVRLAGFPNPYGDGHAAPRIVAGLRRGLDDPRLLRKRWNDSEDGAGR